MRSRALGFFVGLIGCLGVPGSSRAFDLELPVGARETAARASQIDSFEAPVGRFANGVLPVLALEGAITRRAWRVATAGLTPLQLIVPIREQIEAAGYEVIFECSSEGCGGFDFRFATEVLPGPNMYVNIASYRYLTAFQGPRDAPVRALGVLVTVTAAVAYVQLIQADTGADLQVLLPEMSTAPQSDLSEPIGAMPAVNESNLIERGFVVLRDLEFATGSTDLGVGPFGSLDRLAAVLRERTDLRVALVGHTDTVGGLAPNIAISKARAQAVRERLIRQYEVEPGRLDAEGMGYLAPIASNLTAQGRQLNRRVEAILLGMTP